MYRRQDGEFVRASPLRESQSAWQLLTTNSKAEYTPRPGVYAPKTMEEVVTTVVDGGGGEEEVIGGRLRGGGIDGFYDYVRVGGERAGSISPILTRRRVRSTDR